MKLSFCCTQNTSEFSHTLYKGMTLKDVQNRFVNDYGKNWNLWICTEREFDREIFAENTIRVLVIDGIVKNTSCG